MTARAAKQMDAQLVWAHLWAGNMSPELQGKLKGRLLLSPPAEPKELCELIALYLYYTDRDHPALKSANMLLFGGALIQLALESAAFEVFGLEPPPPEVTTRIKTIVTK